MHETPAKVVQSGRADQTPLPVDGLAGDALVGADRRVVDAWCVWLDAMAKDAEAALAAAMAYKELDGAARDVWVRALEHDTKRVGVPRIAVYAPLLAVESDPERRGRIARAIGPEDARATPRTEPYGLTACSSRGFRVATVVMPLYLDFVQVLACGFRPRLGFDWVRHDPIVELARAPRAGDQLEGAVLEPAPLNTIVDELAEAVLAHPRSGRPIPEALRVFADLFGPNRSGLPTLSEPGL